MDGRIKMKEKEMKKMVKEMKVMKIVMKVRKMDKDRDEDEN